jgi:hypothetical protein
MPTLGLRLGEALARERRQAGDKAAADLIASFTGRLAFLRGHVCFTDAATALGMPCSVRAQIAALEGTAHALNAGKTAEEGAAALDRMEKAQAVACYLSEVRRR